MGRDQSDLPSVVGIDVGGHAKGFHAVAIRDREVIAKITSRRAPTIAAWCVANAASIVAVDAPCRWRTAGQPSRAVERELAQNGISSFSTPTQAAAEGRAFYTWMFAGMDMYDALAPHFPLYFGGPKPAQVCIETFPQAVACALAGEIVSAKQKNTVRRGLLKRYGLDETALLNIDEVDAALCAIAADAFACGNSRNYGDSEGGFIVVPSISGLVEGDREKPHSDRRVLNEILHRLPKLSRAERLMLRSRLDDLIEE